MLVASQPIHPIQDGLAGRIRLLHRLAQCIDLIAFLLIGRRDMHGQQVAQRSTAI